MKKIVRLAYAVMVLGFAQPCWAGFVVSLSSPDALGDLTVGQTITLDVNLAGASLANSLDALGITVAATPTDFNTPTITAGSVVPDASGFFTAPGAGVADATYDDLFATSGMPIASNGVFFSAQFIAMKAGTGAFQFTNISGFQGLNQVTVGNGTPDGLAFTIHSQSAVPEPDSCLLAVQGCTVLAVFHAYRARKRS